jgi:hypothetical protein
MSEDMILNNNKTKVEKHEECAFLCSVCYTESESEAGLVKPASCKHKICMECFSRIIMEHKENSKCPECRTNYLKQTELQNNKNNNTEQEFMVNAITYFDNIIENDFIHLGGGNANGAAANSNLNNLNDITNNINTFIHNMNLNNITNYYQIDNYYYIEDRNGNLFTLN